MAVGDARHLFVPPVLAGPHFGGGQHHAAAQVLRELQHQLVEWDRSGEPLTEGAQRLVGGDPDAVHEPVGSFGQPATCGQVEQRGDRGSNHRQQEQRAFAALRCAPEPEDDDHVDTENQRSEPGKSHRVGEQSVDACDHLRLRAGDDGDRHEAGHGECNGAGVVRPLGQQSKGDHDEHAFGCDGESPADPLHAAALDRTGDAVAQRRRVDA